MKDSLVVGIEAAEVHRVNEGMSPPHLAAKVLSTPSMIELIESTCLNMVHRHLDDSETTVGTHVNVSHTGPVAVGEEVRVEAKLSEIRKRRLQFDVEVHSPRGSISTGTHERAVVDLSRFSS